MTLGEILRDYESGALSTADALSALEQCVRLPLSEAQRDVWLLHKAHLDQHACVPLCISCSGVDVPALQAAFHRELARTPILRARLHDAGDTPKLSYAALDAFKISEEDVSSIPETEILAHLRAKLERPFDLANGPLVRLSVLSHTCGKTYLLLAAHQLVLDARSLSQLMTTLVSAYRERAHDTEARGQDVGPAFEEFLDFERERLRSEPPSAECAGHAGPLRAVLASLATSPQASGSAQPVRVTYTSALSEHQISALSALARTSGSNVEVVLLATLHTLLYRYTGQAAINALVPVDTRPADRFDSTLGNFVSLWILSSHLNGTDTFHDHVRRLDSAARTVLRLARAQPSEHTQHAGQPPNVAQRAAASANADSAEPAIEVAPRTAPLPLSFHQRRLWFLAQLATDSPSYNEATIAKVSEPVDVAVLERCFSEIIRRHEAWRTVFIAVDGEPTQHVLPPYQFRVQVVDLSGLPRELGEREAERLATEHARRPFDLRTGPLIRAMLARLSETESRLFVTVHHIICDGVSFFNVFVPELHALYAALASGAAPSLPELPIQYADFAVWQRASLTGEKLERRLAYWRTQLDSIQELSLPTDYPRPADLSWRGARVATRLSPELVARLREHAHAAGTTLFTALVASWKVLLSHWCGQTDIVVGSAAAGRSRPELAHLLGYFSSTLVLRTQLEGSMTFMQLLARVHEVVRAAREHQDVPFERLVAESNAIRSLNKNPLFTTAVNLMPPATPGQPWQGWSFDRFDIGTAKVDLYLDLHPSAGGLDGYVEYQSELFAAPTMRRLVDQFELLLRALAADPLQSLAALPCAADGAPSDLHATARTSLGEADSLADALVDSAALQVGYSCRGRPLAHELSKLRAAADPSFALEVVPELFQTNPCPLSLDVCLDGEAQLRWAYDPSVYAADTVERLADSLPSLIDAAAASSGRELLERLTLLGSAQRQQLLEIWNRTDAAYPEDKTCVELFVEHAAAAPDRPALSYGDVTLTYGELHEQSSALAHALLLRGAGASCRVGLCVARSLDMVLGMLAIMKCGAAYVPLDPDFPDERLSHMLKDSDCKLILSQPATAARLEALKLEGVELFVTGQPGVPVEARADAEPASIALSRESAAFIIYTSGSTGSPKGVVISHASVTNLLLDTLRRFELGPRDRLLAIAPYSFDMAATEIYAPLVAGAHCRIADSDTIKDAALLARTIEQWHPTLMLATPATWSRLFRVGWKNSGGMRLLSGGEPISAGLMEQMLAGGEAWNLYGPTETTMHCAAKRLRRGEPVTIGKPIANTQAYVVDRYLQPVPIGVIGELCISGRGVALGYHNRPELTAERFINNPFRPGERLYKTGDLARWLPQGELELFARIDDQVKLRGFRVELAEIERCLNRYPGVHDSAVVVVRGQDQGDRLAAYFTTEDPSAVVDKQALRTHMKKALPSYMVAHELVQLAALPLTPSGKVDKRRLSVQSVDPHTEHERRPVTRVDDARGLRAASTFEQRLRTIFQKAVAREDFGNDDGFFEVGGDSISAVGTIERINQEFGCDLKVTALFAHASIAAMARHLQEKIPEHAPAAPPEPAMERGAEARGQATATPPTHLDDALAIVGISCEFPGAKNPHEFWQKLVRKEDFTSFWTHEELLQHGAPEAVIGRSDYVPVRTFLEGRGEFDAAFFNVSPRDAELMDPQARLLLMHAWRAIEDAGYRPEALANTSVYMSTSNNFYQAQLASVVSSVSQPQVLENAEDYVAWMFAQGGSTPTLVSHRLGLKGPSLYVGTNCSSSLSALYLASQGLRARDADAALVGAATITAAMTLGYVHQPGLNLSSTGRCKVFDDAADGMACGEGVGVVLLKRAADAIADGDHVYCFIRGIAVNNDGSDKAGFYAPSVNGQADVIQKALEKTRVDPRTICYVEAHGTGTKLGDPIEVSALTQAFGGHTAQRQFCGIGSVKSNLGHLDAAAGIAGLIKVALSLHHAEIPATVNCETVNRHIDWASSPFYVVTDNVRLEPHSAHPHRAGLSSFGIGGTNVHAILEEARLPRRGAAPDGDPHLVILSAKSGERLKAAAQELLRFLPEYRGRGGALSNLAYTLQVGRQPMLSRVAFVVRSLQGLAEQLSAYIKGEAAEAVFEGTVKRDDGAFFALFEDAEELRAIKAQWLARRDWQKLARLWVSGVEIEWSACYGAERPARVSLPTYPFSTQRYWLSAAATAAPPQAAVSLGGELAVKLSEHSAELLERLAGGGGVAGLLARHEAETSAMDAALRGLLFVQLASLGLLERDPTHGESGANAVIAPGFSRWLAHSLQILTASGHAKPDGTPARASAREDAWGAWRAWKESRREDVEAAAKARLAERMLEALPQILTGSVAATEIMFPKGSLELVEGLYKQNAMFAFFNGVIGRATHQLAQTLYRRSGRPVRILEIGAGTGSTSDHVFEQLREFEECVAEYCYTDLSKAFVIAAERRYAQRIPYLTFHAFDAERAPGAQGLRQGQYDIVIANNVLHATRDVAHTVSNARALLAPGGFLLLNEIAEHDLLGHLTFGLLEGWWRYTDERRLPGGPGLSPASWSQVLRENGFSAVHFPTEGALRFGLQVIVAQADTRERTAPAAWTAPQARLQPHASHRPVQTRVLPAAPPALPRAVATTLEAYVESAITECLMAALKLERHMLQKDGPFADHGLDSLTGVGLVNQLNQRLGLDLNATVLFDHPTLERLTRFLLDNHRASLLHAQQQAVQSEPDASAAESGPVPLHADSTEPHAGPQPRTTSTESRTVQNGYREPIAIIGMSGRFPRANDVDELWSFLEQGADLVSEAERWDLRSLGSRCLHGGFMEGVELFDPLFFNISGLEATYMEPQQRLFLEESWKALEDAGYAGHIPAPDRSGVYVGCAASDYFDLNTPADYPAQALWGNMAALVPSRLAYHLDLHGPALAVDTACSSSLVAIHTACRDLWDAETDLAVAGGVFIPSSPKGYLAGTRAGMLSPSGRCRSFDNRADGFVPAEGVGVLILKRLSDAQASGDNIHGVIRGIGINQDGTTNGITAPSALAQERLIRRVYDSFGIDCEGIQMIEAHGTGTKLGDPVEFQALMRAFRHYTDKQGYCSLGSSKANLGHAQLAAGVIGIIKVLMAMRHKTIPPLANYEVPNANVSLQTSPFFIHTQAREWKVEDGHPRRAAVTSLGASGTNAHVVIEEAPARPAPRRPDRPRLVALSARTSDALRTLVQRLLSYCEQHPSAPLADLSYTLLLGRASFECRFACVAEDLPGLRTQLSAWLTGTAQAAGIFAGTEGRVHTQNGTSPYRPLQELAARYQAGEQLHFEELFRDGDYRRISLPTYAFERTRYAVLPRESGPGTEGRDAPLGKQDQAQTADGFTKTLSGDEFFLKHHVVQGTSMLPGAMYLELACNALIRSNLATAPGTGQALCLRNVVFLRPLRVAAQAVTVRTRVHGLDGPRRFEIVSGSAGAETLHCEGEYACEPPRSVEVLDLGKTLASLQPLPTSAEQFYAEYEQLGIAYGPSFRACKTMYSGDGSIVAELQLPDIAAATLSSFSVHPVVVDAAIQCVRPLVATRANSGEERLVFGLKEVQVFASCSRRMWARIRFAPEARERDKFDIDIADESGRICIAMRGIASRRVAATQAAETSAAVALLPVWEVADQTCAEPWPQPSDAVAVLARSASAQDVLRRLFPRAQLLADSDRVRDEARPLDLEHAVGSAAPFEHLFWVSPEAAPQAWTPAGIICDQSSGTLELLRLVKALLAAGYAKRPLGWTLITQRAHAREDDDASDPTHAGVAGIAGSLAKEFPNWRVRVVDLAAYDIASLRAVVQLAPEPDGNLRIRRGEHWFQQRLARLESPLRETGGFRKGGVYVLAGGAGGLGMALSEHLLGTYGAKVAWLGRSPKSAVAQRIARLSGFGVTPLYIQADATDAQDLHRAHLEVTRHFGAVHGVINSALVLSEASLAKANEADFHAVLQSKIDLSVRLLHEFQGDTLELALFLSSINSYLKALGQASYAAGCLFMDALALQAGRRYGCRAKVINLGYCFNNAERATNRGLAPAKDIGLITRAELLTGIEALVAGGTSQLTLMRSSPGLNTRGMAFSAEGVVVLPAPNGPWHAQAASAAPESGSAGRDLEKTLARLPDVRERVKEIAAMAI